MKSDLNRKEEGCARRGSCCGGCSACAGGKNEARGFLGPIGRLVSAMGARATFSGLKIFCKQS